MDFASAHQMATGQQQAVRRSGWPEGHHLQHRVEESQSKLKLNAPGQEPQDWAPGDEDVNAQDWEEFQPEQEKPADSKSHKK